MTIKRGPGGIGKVGALGQSDLIAQIAAGIKRQEGFAPGTLAYRNNNPGNLRPLPNGWPGQVGVDASGFAVFGSLADGEAALDRQIQTNIDRGLTLNEFFAGKPGVYAGYAPAADKNQPNVYASNVAGWAGIDPNVPLVSLLASSGSPVIQDFPATSDEVPPDDYTAGMIPFDPLYIALGAAAGYLAYIAFTKY